MIKKQQQALSAGGLDTFLGVYERYKDECAVVYKNSGWNDNTTLLYDNVIRRHIVPSLSNHDKKAMKDYTIEDFQQAIDHIKRRGKGKVGSPHEQFDEDTIKRFWSLIRAVVTVAVDHGLCADIFSPGGEERQKYLRKLYERRSLVPKSLTPVQELEATRYLMDNCIDDGRYVALLLMLALGLRCAEACGLSFSDIVPLPGYPTYHCVRILWTTKINSNEIQLGGKSDNAFRLIPLPDRVFSILEEIKQLRKKDLEKRGDGQPVDMEDAPIACIGKKYACRCQTADISRAGRTLFEKIGMRREEVDVLEILLRREESVAEGMGWLDQFSLLEKNATSYLFRRHFVTVLYILGFSEQEIMYIVGHEIVDSQIKRNDFSDPEKLIRMKRKMDRRPIMNPIELNHTLVLEPGQVYCETFSGKQKFIIPAGAGKVRISVKAKEPDAVAKLTISSPVDAYVKSDVAVSFLPGDISTESALDIIQEFYEGYMQVIDGYVITLPE